MEDMLMLLGHIGVGIIVITAIGIVDTGGDLPSRSQPLNNAWALGTGACPH
jgi:hypothetical protein